jgi:uncharacterized protein (DUF58 family)
MDWQEERIPSVFSMSLIQFFVAILSFIALLNGQRSLAILGFLVLGLMVAARLWARVGLSGVTCLWGAGSSQVFPGEKVALRLQAENHKFLPIWLRIAIPLLRAPLEKQTLSKESGLLWYQRAHFEWEIVARKRGVYRIGPPRIRAGDLMGFFQHEKKLEQELSLIVYPRLIPLKPFSIPARDIFGVPGAKSPVQDPVYILGTRDYQHGEPAKYIHWKATARHHRLQEKVFEPSRQEKILLLVQVEGFAQKEAREDFESTLEVVASLAVRLERRGYAVGLVTNGVMVGEHPRLLPVSRNPRQIATVLEVLARLDMKAGEDLLDILYHRLQVPWGITCLYFSYEKDNLTSRAADYFKRERVPVLFFTCSKGLRVEESSPQGPAGKILDEIRMERLEKT